jgi:hypothetical protein
MIVYPPSGKNGAGLTNGATVVQDGIALVD